MSDTAQAAVIQEHCKELKLAAVVRDYPALCRQARDGGWAYEDLLRELLEAEVTNRRQSTARRLLREARFPDIKTLELIDWPALKGVSRPKILELSSCQYIGQAETSFSPGRWIQRHNAHLAMCLNLLGLFVAQKQFAAAYIRI
jgi:DNA replication protein DnaC